MVIATHELYDSVLVGTGKQICLEPLSENGEWRRRCDVERQVIPGGGTRNCKRPLADCREKRSELPDEWEVEDRSRRLDVMSAKRVKYDCK